MSEEIKLIFEDVENTLAELRASVQSLKPTSVVAITDNQLATADKLNMINQTLDQVITSYKTLLLNNEEATINSVKALKDTEEKAASAIQLLE
ncbi:hypothetical protein GCM10011409_07330 [Lentibacillus populi]|uniref:YwqI/YxiC family protein n=1 Tax=Lentibacillus populi TaxID=1827502 RepID=A0A9W5X453_9BACI|nr:MULTISPECIES: YwqI/YxiC family protein [Bacillaceae]MBT2216766.1 DUF5344 family protein [Virgibacillus dakarensis]GGB32447.1 hypothetical protein GCM10011409_07330 [Lentibacillus populi]